MTHDTDSESPRQPDHVAGEHGIADVVREFLTELPQRQREVFNLVDLQDATSIEVSEMLNMKPVTVRANLFRARRALRARILERHPALAEEYRS
jgi:RNA polymerase sigma-70 factor (ECF subfamily)